MTILENEIIEKGIKKKWIAQELGISTKTLNNWLKYENIDQIKKFIQLCVLLNHPIINVLEEIYLEEKK